MYFLSRKRGGIGHLLAILGLIVIVAGVADAFVPACTDTCTTSATTIGTPNVICNATTCTAYVPVTNNNVTDASSSSGTLVPYYKVCDGPSAPVPGLCNYETEGSPVTIPVGTTQTLTTSFGASDASGQPIPLGTGSYVFEVFLLDYEGYAVSALATAVPTAYFTLQVNSGQSVVTVTAGGSSAGSPCGTFSGSTLLSATCTYNVPDGASVTLSAGSLVSGFSNWGFYDTSGNQLSISTANPTTFSMTKNEQVFLNTAGAPGQSGITISASPNNQGTITPASATVFSSSSIGATSATFTVATSQGYTSAGGSWVLYGCNAAPIAQFPGTSSGTSATLTYAQLQSATSACGGTGPVYIGFDAVGQPTLSIQDSTTYPGVVTLSAHDSVPINAPGQTFLNVNDIVTVTASAPSAGYYLGGWLVNGVVTNIGLSSVKVTMTAGFVNIAPIILKQPSGCTLAAGQTSCSGTSTTSSGSITITYSVNCSYSASGVSCSTASTVVAPTVSCSNNVIGQAECTTSESTSTGGGSTTSTSAGGGGSPGGNQSAVCDATTFSPKTNVGIGVNVINSTGGAIKGAVVSSGGHSVKTDANGNALLTNIAAKGTSLISKNGNDTVTVTANGYNSQTQKVQVTEGDCSNVTFTLTSGISIGGIPVVPTAAVAIGLVMIAADVLQGKKK